MPLPRFVLSAFHFCPGGGLSVFRSGDGRVTGGLPVVAARTCRVGAVLELVRAGRMAEVDERSSHGPPPESGVMRGYLRPDAPGAQYWFVLSNERLTYFESQDSREPLGCENKAVPLCLATRRTSELQGSTNPYDEQTEQLPG